LTGGLKEEYTRRIYMTPSRALIPSFSLPLICDFLTWPEIETFTSAQKAFRNAIFKHYESKVGLKRLHRELPTYSDISWNKVLYYKQKIDRIQHISMEEMGRLFSSLKSLTFYQQGTFTQKKGTTTISFIENADTKEKDAFLSVFSKAHFTFSPCDELTSGETPILSLHENSSSSSSRGTLRRSVMPRIHRITPPKDNLIRYKCVYQLVRS